MGLFDVIDEITEKQIVKTETGDNRIFGVMTGIVAKNYDKDMPGRICVTIPVRDNDANELKWARMVMPSSGKSWGHYFLPEVGDQVLLVFEQGNIEKPYVIGCIPKDNNKYWIQLLCLGVSVCFMAIDVSAFTFLSVFMYVVPITLDLVYSEFENRLLTVVRVAFLAANAIVVCLVHLHI